MVLLDQLISRQMANINVHDALQRERSINPTFKALT